MSQLSSDTCTPGTNRPDLRIRGVRLGTEASAAPAMNIVIHAGRIMAVHATTDEHAYAALQPAREIDGCHLLAFPGFINAHAHSNESFEQGAYEGLPLEAWLALAYSPLHAETLPPRWHYLRAMLLGLQSLRSGVTTVHDDFLNPRCDAQAVQQVQAAYEHLGLRARIALTLGDRGYRDALPRGWLRWPDALRVALDRQAPTPRSEQLAYARAMLQQQSEQPHSLVRFTLGPRGPQRCSAELLNAVAEISHHYDVPVHMHVLESRLQALTAQHRHGASFITILKRAGVLTHRLALNHAIWLTHDDIDLLAAAGAKVVHNPLSNLKLGSGICPVKDLLANGVELALGTDGAATGDSLDMFDTLRLAALVHTLDAQPGRPAPTAAQVVAMGTTGGAASLGATGELGVLRAGAVADITLLDAHDPTFVPLNDPQRQLCFAATSRSVHSVIVDGQVVYAQGRAVQVDEAAVLAEIRDAASEFQYLRQRQTAELAAPLQDTLARFQRLAHQRSASLATLNQIHLR